MNEQDQALQETYAGFALEHEKELLKHEAENLRTFYSLTGPARKDYTIQMAEADASRIRTVYLAQADGILALRKAEAEGYRLIGEALASIPNSNSVIEIAGLLALQKVAQALGEGKATKIFIPQNLGGLFSMIGALKNLIEPESSEESKDGNNTPKVESKK